MFSLHQTVTLLLWTLAAGRPSFWWLHPPTLYTWPQPSVMLPVLSYIPAVPAARASPSPAGGLYPEPRHNIGKVHSHGAEQGAEHDTEAAIQTILDTLGAGQWTKQSNVTAFSCSEAGTFPHPWDCSKYYLCTEEEDEDGDEEEEKEKKLVTTEYECLYDLTGLLFDTVTGSCVWAAKAKCFSDKSDGIEAVEAEVEIDYECESEGLVPDPDFCMRYFRCDENLEVHLEYCATGTFYDTSYEKCLWASSVRCGDRQEVDRGEDDLFRRNPAFLLG